MLLKPSYGYWSAFLTVSLVSSAFVAQSQQRGATTGSARSGLEFVRIAPGTFQMGCSKGDNQCNPDEKPAFEAQITKGFELGKYEVTQAQWREVMGMNPSNFKGDSLPVETVSWDDTQQFLTRLNARQDGYRYRLPTEAEWEFAARAGSTEPIVGNLSQTTWYNSNSGKQTHPIGQKQANAWGLHDMQGNVWEWVQDWYGDYPSTSQSDPKGPASGSARVMRGGSWYVAEKFVRVSVRSSSEPGTRGYVIGFRIVREAQP
jgi:formylglycine-generating enzyme required for sulfatase activity